MSDKQNYSDEELLLLQQFRAIAGQALANPDFTIAQVAKPMGLSERSLYRKFKELTGRTPASYLREFRLEKAHELLLAGQANSVDEVAFAVGFDDVAYFARVFYRRYRLRANEMIRK